MKRLLNVTVQVNNEIYLKDPQSSDLGRRIVFAGAELIDEVGFEQFTFRKLAARIQSTEASVYRYFESKNKLLIYLTSWYWGWMELHLVFSTANISDSYEKLDKAIDFLISEKINDYESDFVNVSTLSRIVISESSKAYLTRQVDSENQIGAFLGYKRLVHQVSEYILEINESYKYPHMLVSTVIEGAHHQRFFAEHLPRLTDHVKGEDSIVKFFREMVFKSINGQKPEK